MDQVALLNPPQVAGTIAGWGGGFHTDTNSVNGQPSIPISAEEILDRVKALESVCDKDFANNLLKMLSTHIKAKDNPHHFGVDQLETDVTKLLYQMYLEKGHTGSYDFFKENLFQLFQIAAVKDINEGTPGHYLVTAAAIQRYITAHNTSPTAHRELIQKLVPGKPVTDDPGFALSAYVGVPGAYQTGTDKYTYIGADGYLYQAETPLLPYDYTYGRPMVPMWENRTNLIVDAMDCTKASWEKQHVELSTYLSSPMRGKTGYTVVVGPDVFPCEHALSFSDIEVEEDNTYTFSCYYAPDIAKTLLIRISGTSLIIPTIDGVFKLDSGMAEVDQSIGINAKATITPLTNGYSRVSLTWRTGRSDRITIKMLPLPPNTTVSFEASSKMILGTIWGAQLEKGNGASPFIPTQGKTVTRKGTALSINTPFMYKEEGTYAFEYYEPTPFDTEGTPLFSLVADKSPCMDALYNQGYLLCRQFNTNGMPVWMAPVLSSRAPLRVLSLSFSQSIQRVGATGVPVLDSSKSSLGSIPFSTCTSLHVGHNASGRFLNGYIGRVVYYDRVLTTDEHTFLLDI